MMNVKYFYEYQLCLTSSQQLKLRAQPQTENVIKTVLRCGARVRVLALIKNRFGKWVRGFGANTRKKIEVLNFCCKIKTVKDMSLLIYGSLKMNEGSFLGIF